MSNGRDDDAFAWEGDDDPTLDSRAERRNLTKPSGDESASAGTASRERRADADAAPTTRGVQSAPSDRGHSEPSGEQRDEANGAGTAPGADEEPRSLGNVELVALGVLGGIYVFIAMGWIIGGLRLHGVADYLVSGDGVAPVTWSAGNLAMVWLAVLAPVIWFATVFLLTRQSAPWLRWVLLLAGMLLLLPWPFIMVGTVGT